MASFPPNKRVGSMVKVDELPTNNNKNNQVQDVGWQPCKIISAMLI